MNHLPQKSFNALINLIVDPEYVCDWFKAMPGATQAERWAEVSNQPYEVAENPGNNGKSSLDQLVTYLNHK